MKKFSTGLLLAAFSVLPAAAAPLPQARGIAEDAGRLPVMVLDAGAGPFAEVAGPAATQGGRQLLSVGQVVRIVPAAARDGFLAIYRPGPMLLSTDGRTGLGRMAFLVGNARIVRRGADGNAAEATIVSASREIVAGDMLMMAPAPNLNLTGDAGTAMPAVAARVAVQSGAERVRLAAIHQVLGLDRGTVDGVRTGMCLRAGECGGHGAIIGRVLHAGDRASAAQITRAAVLLEWGDEICVAACPD